MSLPQPRLKILLLLFVLTTGCRSASPPAAYYALSAMDRPQHTVEISAASPTIGIGPVTLPDYLDRPQMVVRTGPHQLRLDDDHLWAAPLSDEIVRVLAENMLILTESSRVARFPWRHQFKPDFVIAMQVFKFEATTDGQVFLATAVTLSDRRTNNDQTWMIHLEERAATTGHSDLVAAQSRLIVELGRRITDRLSHLTPDI